MFFSQKCHLAREERKGKLREKSILN